MTSILVTDSSELSLCPPKTDKMCMCMCACVGVVEWYGFQGSAGSFPGIQTARDQNRESFPGEQPFPLTAAGPRPATPAYPRSALVLRQGCRLEDLCPACLPCNKIVYSTSMSRNKTTESNIANRCLQPGPRVPARCSFENLWRGEAGSLVPPDLAGWGGGCCWN